jgi:hypothetical protein
MKQKNRPLLQSGETVQVGDTLQLASSKSLGDFAYSTTITFC